MVEVRERPSTPAEYYHALLYTSSEFRKFYEGCTYASYVRWNEALTGRGLEEARRVYYNAEIEDLRLYITYRDKRPLEGEARKRCSSSRHEPARPPLLDIHARRGPSYRGSLIAKTSAIATYYSCRSDNSNYA